MKTLKWDESRSVGIPELDADHRAIVEIYNKLFAACAAGQGASVLGDILEELGTFARDHFAREDLILEEHKVPGWREHIKEHAWIIGRLVKLRADLADGREHDVSMETLSTIRDWIEAHTSDTDLRYAEHLGTRPRR